MFRTDRLAGRTNAATENTRLLHEFVFCVRDDLLRDGARMDKTVTAVTEQHFRFSRSLEQTWSFRHCFSAGVPSPNKPMHLVVALTPIKPYSCARAIPCYPHRQHQQQGPHVELITWSRCLSKPFMARSSSHARNSPNPDRSNTITVASATRIQKLSRHFSTLGLTVRGARSTG